MPARAYGTLWRWMDNGWMDGLTDGLATDGWMYWLYVRAFMDAYKRVDRRTYFHIGMHIGGQTEADRNI